MSLNERRRAAAVMCAMIVVGLLLGAYTSGRRLYGKVEDIFYNGAKGNGIGVASDLGNRTDAGLNLTVIAARYLDPDDKALVAVHKAIDTAQSAKTIADRYEADLELNATLAALYDALGQKALSEKDEKYRSSIYADFCSYGMTMSHDPYNEAAADYNREVGGFPGGILFALFGYHQVPIFR